MWLLFTHKNRSLLPNRIWLEQAFRVFRTADREIGVSCPVSRNRLRTPSSGLAVQFELLVPHPAVRVYRHLHTALLTRMQDANDARPLITELRAFAVVVHLHPGGVLGGHDQARARRFDYVEPYPVLEKADQLRWLTARRRCRFRPETLGGECFYLTPHRLFERLDGRTHRLCGKHWTWYGDAAKPSRYPDRGPTLRGRRNPLREHAGSGNDRRRTRIVETLSRQKRAQARDLYPNIKTLMSIFI